jgi:hypothetical protein
MYRDLAEAAPGRPEAVVETTFKNYLKRPQRVIPDLIRNLPDASSAVFREILNRVQDDLPVLR